MERPPSPEQFNPIKRSGVILLLESTGWNLQRLTPKQVSRIRELFFLDPPDSEKSIAQLVLEGKITP